MVSERPSRPLGPSAPGPPAFSMADEVYCLRDNHTNGKILNGRETLILSQLPFPDVKSRSRMTILMSQGNGISINICSQSK